MRRALTVLLISSLAVPGVAFALSQSSMPPKFGIPWANSAGAAYVRSIPATSQIGIQNCAASLPDGFPPLTFVPSAGGGCPPFGQDFNGILRQLSQWNQWQAAGGPVFYDGTFAVTIGGYPKGAILTSVITPGTQWMSTVDGNSTDPDGATPTGWVQAPGQVPIGTPVQALTTTVPTGYVSANGLTIGDASSNATNRANADTQFLFAFVWSNCPAAQCPIYTSAGSGSTRGVSAAADFAAHKQIAVYNLNGTAMIGADSQNGTTSTNLSGVPVTSGGRTVPGSILGENLHALLADENGQHSHGVTDPGHTHAGTFLVTSSANPFAFGPNYAFGSGNVSPAVTGISIQNSGLGTPHNTVPRSVVVYWNLKL